MARHDRSNLTRRSLLEAGAAASAFAAGMPFGLGAASAAQPRSS